MPIRTRPMARGELQYLAEHAALNLRFEGELSSLHVVHYVRKGFDAIAQYHINQWIVDLRSCDGFPDSGRFWALLQLLQHRNLRAVLGSLDKVIVVREPAKHRAIDDVLGPIFYRLTKTQIEERPNHPHEGISGSLIL
ncbi:MAG TPA: hypothetical protein DCE41_34105 [Cytophagales bacterium]|nr:hypothetical protein [Cytophagales bacterium]